MEARHSGHTGSREMFNRGKWQMRQSDGNKTVKTLSAAPRYQGLAEKEGVCPETRIGLSLAAKARLARIRSPLLLKTASFWGSADTMIRGRYESSISATMPLGNVPIRGNRLLRCRNLSCFRQTVADRRKDQAIIAPEALSAANRLQKHQGQQKSLEEIAPPRPKSHLAAAIVTNVGLGKAGIGGSTHKSPRKYEMPKGRIAI